MCSATKAYIVISIHIEFFKPCSRYLISIRIANRANNDPIETKTISQSVCQEFQKTLINSRSPIGGWHTECGSLGTSKEDGYGRRTPEKWTLFFRTRYHLAESNLYGRARTEWIRSLSNLLLRLFKAHRIRSRQILFGCRISSCSRIYKMMPTNGWDVS